MSSQIKLDMLIKDLHRTRQRDSGWIWVEIFNPINKWAVFGLSPFTLLTNFHLNLNWLEQHTASPICNNKQLLGTWHSIKNLTSQSFSGFSCKLYSKYTSGFMCNKKIKQYVVSQKSPLQNHFIWESMTNHHLRVHEQASMKKSTPKPFHLDVEIPISFQLNQNLIIIFECWVSLCASVRKWHDGCFDLVGSRKRWSFACTFVIYYFYVGI